MTEFIFNPLPSNIGRDTNERTHAFEDDNSQHVLYFIREIIQNFLDNISNNWTGPAILKIRIPPDSDIDFDYVKIITKSLKPFLKEEGINQVTNKRVLIAEEFGSTGFCGDLSDNLQTAKTDHARFWFHSGMIYEKKKDKRGGAGQGEITYPMSSQDRCSFAISVREDMKTNDPERTYLYGKCNLSKPPLIDGNLYQHTGYFGEEKTDDFPKPITDKDEIKEFSDAFKLERGNNPGNSYVIPRLRKNSGFEEKEIVKVVIKEWFSAIASQTLEVHINDIKIDALKIIDENFLSNYLTNQDEIDFFQFISERLIHV